MSSIKVSDVMSHDVSVCRPSDSLDVAARVMWERDCGFVPVVDAAGGLVGVITDRDVCMGGYIGGAPLAEIPVVRVMAREVATVGMHDELARAQSLLREHGLHRLPVVDGERRVLGVVSLADLVTAARAERSAAARKRAAEALLETLAGVKRPRRAPEPVKTVEPHAAPAGAEQKKATRRASAKTTTAPAGKRAVAKKSTSAVKKEPRRKKSAKR